MQPFNLPEDVGIAVGGPGESNVYVLATHYTNEDYIPGMYCSYIVLMSKYKNMLQIMINENTEEKYIRFRNNNVTKRGS